MICHWSSPVSVLVVGFFFAALAPVATAQLDVDPSDLYLKAYLTMRDAEQLESEQKYEYAFERYLEATELFDSVAHSHSSWNPQMVNYRRKKIRAAISELREKAQHEFGLALGTPGGPPSGVQIGNATPAPPPAVPDDPLPLPTHEPRLAVRPAPPTPNVIAKIPGADNGFAIPRGAGPSSIDAATNHIESKFNELHARITQLDTEKQHLVLRLQSRESDLEKTRTELEASKGARDQLEDQLSELQSRVDVDAATGSDNIEALNVEISTLNAQLRIAKGSLESAGAKTAELLAELKGARNEIELLKEERSQLISERHQMTALLGDGGEDNHLNVSHLMALNENLRRQLATAREAAESLASDRDSDKERIISLKAEVASVSEKLAGLESENETYRTQIAKLTRKLESASRDLADSTTGIASNEALEENQMLRDIILRQLRQQARQQQAKELVMAELTKLEVNSENLLYHIDDLAGSRIVLSDKERALFRDSFVAPLLADSDMHGTLLSGDSPENSSSPPPRPAPASRVPAVDSNARIASLASEASRNFTEENFAEAENLYEEILKIDRQNTYTLCNLGIIKDRIGKHAEAEVLFNKALAYDPKHSRAHLMLGILYFRGENFDAALESIGQAVRYDPQNAYAHNYIGLIASHKGWMKRAEEEFKKAISVDPNFAEAYFNLSILYITSEESTRDQAEELYFKALDRGAKPDPVMEQFLEG